MKILPKNSSLNSKPALTKLTATTLINLWQRLEETLRGYLGRFNDATVHVMNPNQEMFVGPFINGLEAKQFHESLAQKVPSSMEEVCT